MKSALRRPAAIALALVAAAAVAFSAAAQSKTDRPRAKDGGPEAKVVEPRAAAQADFARMIVHVASDETVIRQKGLESVDRVSKGLWCIKPLAATGIDVTKSLVIVSVDFYRSEVTEASVQWASKGHGCGAGKFGVYTFADANLDAQYTFSNHVGFVMYVP